MVCSSGGSSSSSSSSISSSTSIRITESKNTQITPKHQSVSFIKWLKVHSMYMTTAPKKHITEFRIYFLWSPKEKEHGVTLNVSNVSV